MGRRIGEEETVGRDGSETGLVLKKKEKQNSTTGIGASLTPDVRDKEERNNMYTYAYPRIRARTYARAHTRTDSYAIQTKTILLR